MNSVASDSANARLHENRVRLAQEMQSTDGEAQPSAPAPLLDGPSSQLENQDGAGDGKSESLRYPETSDEPAPPSTNEVEGESQSSPASNGDEVAPGAAATHGGGSDALTPSSENAGASDETELRDLLEIPGDEEIPSPRPAAGDDPATMHLDDVDVRKVLEILSREHSLNIVVSPNVSGQVTANLTGMTPEQTLNAVLKSCNLVAQREKGVVYVYTPGELITGQGGVQDNSPIALRVYQLNYVRSTDLMTMVKPLLSPVGKITSSPAGRVGLMQLVAPTTGSTGGSGGSSGGGSSGGGSSGGGSSGGGSSGSSGGGAAGGGNQSSVTGGDSLAISDTMLVQDHVSNLLMVDEIVHKLDIQPMQVLIEAVIMSATLNRDHELGVNFGVVDSAGKALALVGNGATLNATAGFAPATVLQAGTGLVSGTSSDGFAANEHGIKFGFAQRNVTGFIRALNAVGKVEVLATPRLLVLNKQPAELLLGNRLGYTTASQSLVSTVQTVNFLNVGTLLRVRPFISTDGMVRMEIHPERSTGQVVNNIPQTSTSEVTTNVIVPDGSTIVIGGLMDNEDSRQQFGVPGLSRIPVLGVLFRERTRTLTKKELIVLLTVQIWNPTKACPTEEVHEPPGPKGPIITPVTPVKPRSPKYGGHWGFKDLFGPWN